MTTSDRGEAALRREKGGDVISWADTNLTKLKMKKIHVVDSAGTNAW
jgi:hypothetical protein